jgi:hypothetical protein
VVLQVLALPLLVIMAALVVTPAVAGLKLVSRLVAVRRQTLPGNRAEHAVHTGILVALLLIPLLVIGLWAVAVAGTQGSGTSAAPPTGPSPSLAAGNLVGTWKTSSGAAVVFTADGRFAETRLPGPLPGDAGNSGLVIPRAAAGTWQISGPRGNQDVTLMFSPATQLDLSVTWQPVDPGPSYFILQLYLGSGADMNPAYELVRQDQ